MKDFKEQDRKGLLGYSKDFWLMCLANMFFFASFNMVIPEFSKFLEGLGGGDYKMWIIASFSLVAMIVRPYSGKITDKVGRMPVMLFGALVCVVCGLGYVFVTGVFLFFFLRSIHGLAAGFTPTGNVAYIADIVHAERRGEAMGWVGISGNIGTAIGPALGGWVAISYSTNTTFILSSVSALLALLIFSRMKETLVQREKLALKHFSITFKDFWEPAVRRVSIVMALTVFSFGTVLTVIPDFTLHLGFSNKGVFFSVFVLSSIIPRLLAGKASDNYGREPVARVGIFILMLSMVVLAITDSSILLMTGAVMMGLAQGIISPTLFAWASDLAPSDGKGRSMATLYIALELGVTLGAYVSGSIYDNNIINLFWVFMVCGALATLSFLYLLFFKPQSYI